MPARNSMRREFTGRVIKSGCAAGPAIVTDQPLSFLGGVNPDSGQVIEPGHPLEGISIAGRILVFPAGKGSTVGSYTIYRLAKNGLAPAGIICRHCEPIVAVGAIISHIPTVDLIPIESIRGGDWVTIGEHGHVLVETRG